VGEMFFEVYDFEDRFGHNIHFHAKPQSSQRKILNLSF
jgi:hypothetical protein